MQTGATAYPATELRAALEEIVKLQAHYAGLLNGYDGGERHQFQSVEEWMDRLREVRKDLKVVDQEQIIEKTGRAAQIIQAGETKNRSQEEADAAKLRYLEGLDNLRQEAGISAAMLRDGRAKGMMERFSALEKLSDACEEFVIAHAELNLEPIGYQEIRECVLNLKRD